MFAARLLSPACVLWALNLHTPKEISAACGITELAAGARAKRMSVLYERNKFLTSSLEKKVFEQFQTFIEERRR